MKRFAGLSLILASQFVARCLCFSLSHHRRSQSCSFLHYALHCSHVMSVAWQHGSVGTCNISVLCEWDSRSIDHDSVGLAQARPNNQHNRYTRGKRHEIFIAVLKCNSILIILEREFTVPIHSELQN